MADHIFTRNAARARWAGVFYIAIIVLGITGEAVLRPMAADTGDAAILRLSILSDTGMALADVALAVLLFALLRQIDEMLALAAMVLRLMQAAVIGANLLVLVAAAHLMATGQDAGAQLMQHALGYDIGLVFFGVNSLIMAWLLVRAGVPRLIGWGVGAAGVVYLLGSVTRLIAPEINAAMQPAYLVPLLAESALALWLVTRRGGTGQPS